MSEKEQRDLDRHLDRMQQRLPGRLARFVHWLRTPSSAWARIPAAIVLIAGGFVGFLPVLGFWMIPLGLILVAQDVPPLRKPMARMLAWLESKLEKRNGRNGTA